MNPYEAPKHVDPPGFRWRARWKRICLGSLCSALIFMAFSSLFADYGKHYLEPQLLIIIKGLIALFELISLTMIGIGGIGWIVSPKPQKEPITS
jgi:hypothetical protein